jgi:D-glycero-D-manno-heptose 1,7-bisphosphate phosphatase
MKAAVFLDRDGVLNRAIVRDGKPHPPGSADEFQIAPDAAKALRALKAAGYKLLVVTNQPDVARGLTTREEVESVHRVLKKELPLDEVFVCYHDGDACGCRKPKPGMLIDAARKHHIDLAHSFMVGDRWRDVEAGQSAGCRTVLIDWGYDERPPTQPPDATVSSLGEAADWILQVKRKEVA